MKESNQIEHMDSEITKTVIRFRQEYELSYASAIGVLHLQIARLEKEALEIEEDED